jgi:tetratricopeptide (TPR) repeat protein
MPTEYSAVDAALADGDGLQAITLVRAAQRVAPNDPHLGVLLLESCMIANQLMCAAHGARTLLRFGDTTTANSTSVCRWLGSARAFGWRASRLHWCRLGEPCHRVTNRSADLMDGAPSIGSLTAVDDGQLWSAENLVSALKSTLGDERHWQGRTGTSALTHATMQHIQGNDEIARDLYAKALRPPVGENDIALTAQPSAAVVRAHAYANLAMLERGARARQHLEAALRLAPDVREVGERLVELARVHWAQAQPKLARHALRRAVRLRPSSSFAHALASELATLRHDYAEATASAARADVLQRARAPQLPACALWTRILPQLPRLWGGAAQSSGAPAPARGVYSTHYRELLLGCGPSHLKLTGSGWHDRESLPLPSTAGASPLPFEDGAFDEVHWCTDDTPVAGPDAAARASDDARAWRECGRVLKQGGLLQVSRDSVPPLSMTTASAGGLPALFAPVRLSSDTDGTPSGDDARTTSRTGDAQLDPPKACEEEEPGLAEQLALRLRFTAWQRAA